MGVVRKVTVPASIVPVAIRIALDQNPARRSDFFHDVRVALRAQIAEVFLQHGIGAFPQETVSQINYLANGKCFLQQTAGKRVAFKADSGMASGLVDYAKYGHDDYSLQAINRVDHGYTQLPSLRAFAEISDFSIGNILLVVERGDYDIDLELVGGLLAAGYCFHITPRKRKSYVCIFGIRFDRELIDKVCVDTRFESDGANDFDELRLGINSFPVLAIGRRSGRLFTCSCFEGYVDVDNIRHSLISGHSEPAIRSAIASITARPGICALCTGRLPRFRYGSRMYYSRFLERYLPYYYLYTKRSERSELPSDSTCNEVENELRRDLGYPSIGKSHVLETMLYNSVRALLAPLVVVRHHRGRELERLEIDIWIPDLLLGIEYQGEQHFKSTSHWGGTDGFARRLVNDARKRELCRSNGYQLIEWKPDDDVGEVAVWERLAPHVRKINGAVIGAA